MVSMGMRSQIAYRSTLYPERIQAIPQRFDPFRDQILKHLALMPRFGIAVS
jgi:hypothetical protein